MAHRRRHARRHSRSFAGLSLGKVTNVFKSPVKPMDVLLGAVAALGGQMLSKWAIAKIWPNTDGTKPPPTFLTDNVNLVNAATVGLVSMFALPKLMPKLASHAGGLTVGALAVAVKPLALKAIPAETVTKYNLGVLDFDRPQRLSGMLVDAPRLPGYADVGDGSLAMSAMDPNDFDEIYN